MNTDPQPDPQEQTAVKEQNDALSDDDFAGEVLGERQAEACNLDEGCERCQ